jgi:hypothetical protein
MQAEESDFWIFHCIDMDDEHNLLPDGAAFMPTTVSPLFTLAGKWGKHRKPWHLWVWFCEEADNYHTSYLMNLTMTMRLESGVASLPSPLLLLGLSPTPAGRYPCVLHEH